MTRVQAFPAIRVLSVDVMDGESGEFSAASSRQSSPLAVEHVQK